MLTRSRCVESTLVVFFLGVLSGDPAAAQAPPSSPLLHGVPAGEATATPLPLSLADAIHRALERNLGAVLAAERVRAAEGTRSQSLGDVLPRLSANLRQSEQVINIAAFGFTGFGGIPDIIGPFGVFDARLALSMPLLDLDAVNTLQSDSAALRAERYGYQSTRDEIVLVVANLYLQATADASRVEAVQSQVATAETLATLAQDQRASGLVAGIEVLRQQVQLAAARQRLIAADAAADKDRLALGRAIGLAAAQAIVLTDTFPFAPAEPLPLEQAVQRAEAARDDVRGAEARLEAAQAARQAAVGAALPSLHLDADYGALGSKTSTAKTTYTVAASLHVPVFEGGAAHGRIEQADAELRQREAELADVRAGLQYEIAGILLDLKTADAEVNVAHEAEQLAQQQVEQARDRFRAGVASSIELSQAQDALATASDQYISRVYAHNLAKVSLARALGDLEAHVPEFLQGRQ